MEAEAAAHRLRGRIDGAKQAERFLAGAGIDVDGVDVDERGRVGGEAHHEDAVRRFLGDAGDRLAGGAEEEGLDGDVRRLVAGGGEDPEVGDDGVRGDVVEAERVLGERTGVVDPVADHERQLLAGVGVGVGAVDDPEVIRRGRHVEGPERRADGEEGIDREARVAVERTVAVRAQEIVSEGRIAARHADRVAGRRVHGGVAGVAREARVRAVLKAPAADRIVHLHPRAVGGGARLPGLRGDAAHVDVAVGVVEAGDLAGPRVQPLLRDGRDEADDVLPVAGGVLHHVPHHPDLERRVGERGVRERHAGLALRLAGGPVQRHGIDRRRHVRIEQLRPRQPGGGHLQDRVARHRHGDAVQRDRSAPERGIHTGAHRSVVQGGRLDEAQHVELRRR